MDRSHGDRQREIVGSVAIDHEARPFDDGAMASGLINVPP